MNIGIFTDTYFPQVSGVATSILALQNSLKKQGHQVYIFTTTDPHVINSDQEVNIYRFGSVPFISFADRRVAVRGLFQAYQVAKRLDLDIIHTQTEFSMGYIGKFVAKALRIPCVHTYHTMYEDYLHYVLNGKLLKPIHVKQMTRVFLHHMSGVIAPSKRVLETMRSYSVELPVRIIPTGIELDKFQREMQVDIREQYHLKPQQPLMLSLSRLAYEKRIDQVIAMMPKIINEMPDVCLIIAGDGPAMADLKQQVKQLKVENNVIFVGMIDHQAVGDFYQAADVFVSASVSESQGLTYIEALAAKTKIVVTHSPYTDQLLDDKSLGQTCENEMEMIAAITNYLKNRDNQQDDAKRQAKLYEISADCFGQKVAEFYQQAVSDYQDMTLPYDSQVNQFSLQEYTQEHSYFANLLEMLKNKSR